MQPQELVQVLATLHLGANLSEATLAKLAALLRPCEFAAGQVIFAEGDDQPWMYLILAGEVALEMCVPARGCTRILTLGPGDLLAWSALLGGNSMTATAIALSPVRTLAAASRDVRALCEADPTFGYEFMRELARALSKRLVATRLQLLDLYDVSAGRQHSAAALL
jgi:CRP/FNR family cyclic AMP-dependent transcriptional regulator